MQHNLICGDWVTAASGDAFERHNPAADDDLIGTFPDSNEQDAKTAVDGVVAGYPQWAETSPERRAEVLRRAADWLDDRQEHLVHELVREEGKTAGEARNETRRSAQNFRYYAAEAMRIAGVTVPSSDGSLIFTAREPVGVVAAITPWNFPLNLPSRKIGPALAAGNGVVFKPSDVTPLMGQRLVEALLDAGLPASVIALLHGGPRAGAAIVGDTRVDAVTFTGSYSAGTAVHQALGPSRRGQLEMGGKNPVIVDEDADLERATEIIVQGAFGLTGQACTGTSRVVAHDAVHDELLDRVVRATSHRSVGNGMHTGVDMGPVATRAQLDKVLHYVDIGQGEGARLETGGERLTDEPYDRGLFVRPAVFSGLDPSMRLNREEVFGPVLGFQRASSFAEAVSLANATDYGLSAGVVTRDVERALRFTREIRSGLVKINQPTTGMALTAPFGGLKNSSSQTFKEQAGETMMHFYTVEKTVYVSS